jgi:hypothetical protein
MEFQLWPNTNGQAHKMPSGLKPDGISGIQRFVRLKLKLHRLKPDGIWESSRLVRSKLNLHRLKQMVSLIAGIGFFEFRCVFGPPGSNRKLQPLPGVDLRLEIKIEERKARRPGPNNNQIKGARVG